MGLTRKLLSVSTLGAVDMRSDKERTARYTQATKKEAKKQTELLRQQTRAAQQAAQRQAVAQPVPQQSAPPPGFFHDPQGGQFLCWWDGVQRTDITQPLAPRPGDGS